MPEPTPTSTPVQVTQVTHFERQLGHVINIVLSGVLLGLGAMTIETSTKTTADAERITALESGLIDVKQRMQESTKDRFTRTQADAALVEINKQLRDHERSIALNINNQNAHHEERIHDLSTEVGYIKGYIEAQKSLNLNKN